MRAFTGKERQRIAEKFASGASIDDLVEEFTGADSPNVVMHPRRAIEEVVRKHLLWDQRLSEGAK